MKAGKNKSLIDNFNKYIDKLINPGCWTWTGTKDKDGYGKIKFNQITTRSHRISYNLYKGEIPDNMIVMHSCDTPSCCNPDHLSVGTQQQNSDDKFIKNRQRFSSGEEQWNHKLILKNIDDILLDKRSNNEIALLFNVTKENVRRIKCGDRWNWYTKIKQVQEGTGNMKKTISIADEIQATMQCVNCIDGKCVEQCFNTVKK